MPLFDMPLEELINYRSPDSEPDDFDAFWENTLNTARTFPKIEQFERMNSPLSLVTVDDVTYSGYGGQPIKGWYLRPREASDKPLPCVIRTIGYGGGRTFPYEWLPYPTLGYATFVMDTRGQGGQWSRGDTGDIVDGANAHTKGSMTQGILDKDTYYYRRLMTDAVLAVELMMRRDDVDSSRIAVVGKSQGGGLSLAMAGLLGDKVQYCLADVPFLCYFRRSVGLTDAFPYHEIAHYLHLHRTQAETVFNTLDYFDGVNFAKRITAESFFSVGMLDTVCPPSSVYAAYNEINAPKDMIVYRWNHHEGGGSDHKQAQLEWLKSRWG